MKSRDLQPRLLYPAKISFRIEGQRKSFPDKKQLKEFIITKLLLCEMLRDLFKKKIKCINNKMANKIKQQVNLKNKLSKQEEQRQNHGY